MTEEMTWIYNNQDKLNRIELMMLGKYDFFQRFENKDWSLSNYSAIRLLALIQIIYKNFMSNN
ncbi:hypothetical protein V7094_29025 [Priestia megaterium]|uniref:hypothetical protein n=1 Tax=Priestia megaterium TaxID=1404 RepID=UPI002FFEC479